MAAITSHAALSLRVNELLGAYIANDAEQVRLGEAGEDDAAEALNGPGRAIFAAVESIRDRSGNPDLIAARILLDLMLVNRWHMVGPGFEWSCDEQNLHLPILEMVADRTTGIVREHTTKALATIEVEIKPEAPDPMLTLVSEYLVLRNAINVAETDEEADTIMDGAAYRRAFDRLADAPPAPTSIEGAAAAVRLVRDECNGGYNPDLIRNVLTVVADALDGEAENHGIDPTSGDFEPYPASLLEALPSANDFSRKHLVTVRMAAAVAARTKADLVQGFAKEPEASMDFHEAAEGTASFLRALADLCEIAAGRMLLAGEAHLKAHREGK